MLNAMAAAREELNRVQSRVDTLIAVDNVADTADSRKALHLAMAALRLASERLQRAEIDALEDERRAESVRLAYRFLHAASNN